jgi:chorismate-pyruvate lyase
VTPIPPVTPDLQTLVGLFYRDAAELGQFEEVAADEMPRDYQSLLAHRNHMTVTVEEYHHSPVNVRVLATRLNGQHYARKILLCRQSDGRVVQAGIVRLNFHHVSDEVRREVESQSAPLGRILIQHNVLREVRLLKLWRVALGADLARLFGLPLGEITYGRTALIDCNGEPAVELLEIVAPV